MINNLFMHLRQLIRVIQILFLTCLLTACTNNHAPRDITMVTSVSTDGHYAITTNTNEQAILWNLQNHTYKIVANHANIYSAYFIKNTNDFMYQSNTDNTVHIENISGQMIKAFNPGFPTYGEVATSDLKNYFASDRWFQLYKTDLTNDHTQQFFYYYCGPNYKDRVKPPADIPYACQEFLGSDQLFGLTLTPNDKTLISTASGALFIWDVASTKLLGTFIKNNAQTVSAINPEGNYVITADIAGVGYHYDLSSQQGFNFFYETPTDKSIYKYINSSDRNLIMEILTLKFITNNEVLIIRHGTPDFFNYATLYKPTKITIDNSSNSFWSHKELIPLKYLPLIPNADTDFNYQKSWPLTKDQFSRDQAIDTSPSAHILVMAQADQNGIIVYQYDPATQTLKQVWAPVVKKPSWW